MSEGPPSIYTAVFVILLMVINLGLLAAVSWGRRRLKMRRSRNPEEPQADMAEALAVFPFPGHGAGTRAWRPLEHRSVCRTEPGAPPEQQPVRSEEGGYRAICDRRATPPGALRGVHGDAECKLFGALDIALACLICLAALARFVGLHAEPLDGLEYVYYMVCMMAEDLPSLIFNDVAFELSHQPLGHLILYLTRDLVTDPTSFRFISALCGAASLWVTFGLIRELLGRRTALLTTLAVALTPIHFWFSRDLTPYALFYLLAVASFLCLLRGIRRGSNTAWFLYSFVLLLAFYTHYLLLVLALAQGLFVLLLTLPRIRRPFGRRVLLSFSFHGLLAHAFFVPWYLFLIHSRSSNTAVLLRDKVSIYHELGLRFLLAPGECLRTSLGLPVSLQVLSIPLGVGLMLALWWIRGDRRRGGPAVFLFLVVPIIAIFLQQYLILIRLYASIGSVFLAPRYWVVVLPFVFAPLIAARMPFLADQAGERDPGGLGRWRSRLRGGARIAIPGGLGLLLVVNVWQSAVLVLEPQRAGTSMAAQHVRSNLRDGDAVVVVPRFFAALFQYYLQPERHPRAEVWAKPRWRRLDQTDRLSPEYFSPIERGAKFFELMTVQNLFFERVWLVDFREHRFGRPRYSRQAFQQRIKRLQQTHRLTDQRHFNGASLFLLVPRREGRMERYLGDLERLGRGRVELRFDLDPAQVYASYLKCGVTSRDEKGREVISIRLPLPPGSRHQRLALTLGSGTAEQGGADRPEAGSGGRVEVYVEGRSRGEERASGGGHQTFEYRLSDLTNDGLVQVDLHTAGHLKIKGGVEDDACSPRSAGGGHISLIGIALGPETEDSRSR